MTIKIRDTQDCVIIDILCKEISEVVLMQLKKEIKKNIGYKRIGINLSEVSTVNHNFFEFLSNSSGNLSVFSIGLNTYLLLFIMEYDRFVDIFVSESDFLANKRSIINRKFKLMKAV